MILGWIPLLFAQTQAPDFARDLYPAFEKSQCRQCHQDNGVASTTRLQFPRAGAAKAEIDAFGLRLRTLVDPANPADSRLLRLPTNRAPHPGGERIKQGSSEEATLRAWVTHLASMKETQAATAVEKLGPSKPVLRRLTHSQYNHTVRDLLGDESNPADRFPKEDFIHGFTNQAEGQSISPLQTEAYAKAAERLARGYVRRGIPEELRKDFVRGFGLRAFRRPLTQGEAARYEKLMSSQQSFDAGATLVAEAMLQSPHFLFLLAEGSYGVAARLSYFLWDTMPDRVLLAAAGSGELNTPKGIEKHVRRMLDDDRARTALDVFVAQWLRFDRIQGTIRDRRTFPEFTDELIGSMTEETRRLFRSLVWEDRNFMELFTARYTFLDPALARVYAMDAPGEPWQKVSFADNSPRAGFLGQALFLALTSKPADTSPTERGLFIREHFLCQEVPPPPPGVNATLPAITDEKPIGTRERLGIHLSNQVCAACHQLVDPIGLGFEHFDAIGRYREKEKITIYPTFDEMKTRRKVKPTEFELPIDAKGVIRGVAGSDFTTPRELGTILAGQPACQKCVVKQLFRFANGRHEEAEDAPVIDAAFARFERSGFRFRELILAIATSETFRLQAGL